jgi:hypothetical protein
MMSSKLNVAKRSANGIVDATRKRLLTKRAPDGWDSARFWALLWTLAVIRFRAFSPQPPVTPAVGQLGTSKYVKTDYESEATKLSLNKCDGNTFNAKSPET